MEIAELAELLEDGTLLLRSAVGWKEGLAGTATLPAGGGSRYARTLATGEPVVVEDERTQTRFPAAPLVLEQGIVSGVSVPIRGAGRPFGVLGLHTKTLRRFSQDDLHFLQSVANVIASAIEREQWRR